MQTKEHNGIDKQIGNYQIIAELNSGTSGRVYKGRHCIFSDDPPVAIKVLHAHLISSQEQELFMHEARLLRKLKHPYILPIIDAGIHEGVPFIVMSYAEQGSLGDRLERHPGSPLVLEEALTILIQIGQALHYAHQQNIVHRDLKPGNILFNARGEALLADFGVATVLPSIKTQEGTLVGTPAYMAPEQFKGIVSVKSDQYALGCIAYEMLTGTSFVSFAHAPLEVFWYHHMMVAPVAPRQLNAIIPESIEQVVLKAMAKERTERHLDIRAFTHALQQVQVPKTAQQWYEAGQALVDRKLYEEALAAYEQAEKLDTTNVRASYRKGAVLYTLQRYKEAVEAYDHALQLDPRLLNAYIWKGRALAELKRYKEALTVYERAQHLDPDAVSIYYNKAVSLVQLQRYEEALSTFEQALQLDPHLISAHNGKGVVLEHMQRYEEALVAYEQALRLNPNDASIYSNKGVVLDSLQRYEEALMAYKQALHFDPHKSSTHHNKGVTLLNLKRYEEALAAYDQALQLDPSEVSAYNGKGTVLVCLKRYEEALLVYEELLRIDPDNTLAYNCKTEILSTLNRDTDSYQSRDH
jgi:tetratricopeptide (TPR) repeat protein